MKIDNKVFSVFWTVFLIVLVFSASSVLADQRYLVGTGNFNDTAIWSATSGGTGGESVPGSNDDVILDANSSGFTVTLNVNATIDSLTISDGTFDASTFFFTVLSRTDVSGGSLILGSGFRTFVGDLTLRGTGTLNCGSSNITLRGNFTISGGTFNAGTSLIRFNGGGGAIQTLGSALPITLNNVTIDQAFPDNIGARVVFAATAGFATFTINGTLEMKY
ncbi:MAG: hypothetical protein EH225_03610, partial [Calditrichaeota bacterium]